jgi:hypothetical protein
MKAKSENAHALPSADIVGMPAEQLLDLLDRSLAENAERHAAPSSCGLLAVAEAAAAGLPPFSSASADDLLPELRIVDALLAGSDQLGSGHGDSAPEWNRPAPPPARLRRRGPHRPAPAADPEPAAPRKRKRTKPIKAVLKPVAAPAQTTPAQPPPTQPDTAQHVPTAESVPVAAPRKRKRAKPITAILKPVAAPAQTAPAQTAPAQTTPAQPAPTQLDAAQPDTAQHVPTAESVPAAGPRKRKRTKPIKAILKPITPTAAPEPVDFPPAIVDSASDAVAEAVEPPVHAAPEAEPAQPELAQPELADADRADAEPAEQPAAEPEQPPIEPAAAGVAAEAAAEPSGELSGLIQAIILAHRPGIADTGIEGELTMPERVDALADLLADPPPATDFSALDMLSAAWGKSLQNSSNPALLAVAYNLTRNFGLPGRLPMASSRAWRMLDTTTFRSDMANQLQGLGQFIADWQKTQRDFLILEFGEIELIEHLFEALNPAEHMDLMAGVMNFKVLSNRRMGLLRRIPTRLRKQVQPLLPAGYQEALTILAHYKALLERMVDPNGFAPIVTTATRVIEEIDKLMKMAAAGAAPQIPAPAAGGGMSLGRIG